MFRFKPHWDTASIADTTTAHDTFAVLPRIPIDGDDSDGDGEWSSTTQGFHGVSNVLNNPHRRLAPPKAHSQLPAVPSADLPRVRRKDFDSYLRTIAPEWDRFVLAASPVLDDPPPRLSKLLTPLDSVPPVFFHPNFDLADPTTFDAVTERAHADHHASDPSSLSHALPLLEKLSHHADTVEQHLVREISLRSTSFFAALSNLQDLQTESEQCLLRVAKLRSLLNDLDANSAVRGLHIVRKEARRLNLALLTDTVRELAALIDMSSVARSLVTAGQWSEALAVISSIESLLPSLPDKLRSDHPSPPLTPPESTLPTAKRSLLVSLPLSSLSAFLSLPSHLHALKTEITHSLTTDLVTALKLDLLDRLYAHSDPPRSVTDPNLSFIDRLRPSIQGLVRTNGIRDAIVSWRQVVTSEVRGVLKHYLPSFDPDEDEKSSRAVTSLLRSMTQPDFLSIVSSLYKSFFGGIEGLQVQNGILMDMLKSHTSTSSSSDLTSLQEEMSDILSSAADLSNKLAATVIGYRSEQLAQLDLPSFLVFFNQSWDFVIRCEVICQRMIMGLRGTILGQAKLFLQTFHQSRVNQSAKLVEDEQWSQMDVPHAVQHAADVLVDSAVQDSPDLIIGGNPPTMSPTNGKIVSSPGKQNGSAASTSKYIHIEERPYFCVSATGAILGLLVEYLKLIVNLPMLNTDTMSRIIEFLKAFNSRTCQVVLGAGAMRSAGLKNITAKHLALASQSLSIMVALIPYVRETFRRHLSPNQAVMLVEFDKLKRDFQEHQNEIHSKLVAIMGDRISAHVKSLQTVNWEVPKQGDGVNEYMELLVKETVTLHKVLSRYLSAPIVEYVMSQVFAAINHRLSEEYGQIELQSQEAKDRMVADARFLHQKFTALKNVSAPTSMLETLVSEKSVPRRATVVNSRTNVSANERLRGLLSRRDSTKPDKPLPSPSQPPSSPGVVWPPTTSSNGAAMNEFVEDSDRVVPPPRSSSRNSLVVFTKADAPTTTDNDDGRDSRLETREQVSEGSHPNSSTATLPCDGNDDVERAALPSLDD